MLIWFLPVFLTLLLIGLPVFFGLLAAPGLLIWWDALIRGDTTYMRDIALLYRNVQWDGFDAADGNPLLHARGGDDEPGRNYPAPR